MIVCRPYRQIGKPYALADLEVAIEGTTGERACRKANATFYAWTDVPADPVEINGYSSTGTLAGKGRGEIIHITCRAAAIGQHNADSIIIGRSAVIYYFDICSGNRSSAGTGSVDRYGDQRNVIIVQLILDKRCRNISNGSWYSRYAQGTAEYFIDKIQYDLIKVTVCAVYIHADHNFQCAGVATAEV
ncbi:hypothetical protein FQZ97_835940 [compost metagenome]